MKRFLLLVALVSSVSFADTNTLDLSEIESTLDSMLILLQSVEEEVSHKVQYTLKWEVHNIAEQIILLKTAFTTFSNQQNSNWTILKNMLPAQMNALRTAVNDVNTNILEVVNYLTLIEEDTDNIESYTEQCLTTLGVIHGTLASCMYYLADISYNTASLPRIEAYQQSLALIVSNINNIVSDVGLSVNLPSSFNVNVQNFPNYNFNPAWDWQYKYIYGTGQPSSETLVWQNSLDLTDIRSTRWRLFPDMHNDVSFASWAGMLYEGLDQGFESLSSSGVRSVLLLNSISNINAQIYNLLTGLSPNTNLVATTDEQTEAASALRQQKLTTDSVNSELSSLDYTPNIYAESLPNISSRPRLSGVVSSHDILSETADFNIDVSGFFQTATDMGYTQFAHPDTTLSVDMRPVNEICIAVRQLFLMIFWMVTIALGAKLCLTVYGLYQTIWSSLMSSDSDIGGGQTVNAINYMRHILPQ